MSRRSIKTRWGVWQQVSTGKCWHSVEDNLSFKYHNFCSVPYTEPCEHCTQIFLSMNYDDIKIKPDFLYSFELNTSHRGSMFIHDSVSESQQSRKLGLKELHPPPGKGQLVVHVDCCNRWKVVVRNLTIYEVQARNKNE